MLVFHVDIDIWVVELEIRIDIAQFIRELKDMADLRGKATESTWVLWPEKPTPVKAQT